MFHRPGAAAAGSILHGVQALVRVVADDPAETDLKTGGRCSWKLLEKLKRESRILLKSLCLDQILWQYIQWLWKSAWANRLTAASLQSRDT